MYTKSIDLILQHDLQVSKYNTESRVDKTSMNYLNCKVVSACQSPAKLLQYFGIEMEEFNRGVSNR